MLWFLGCLTTADEYAALRWAVLDADGDGFVDEKYSEDCTDECDCDDSDPDVNPAATEVCDGIDNDCSGGVDEGLEDYVGWFTDSDGDGYGDPLQPIVSCPVPDSAVQDAGDCDDARADINPGATEICNQTDDDCDSEEDEDVDQTWYRDDDGDGYGDDEVTVFGCEQPTGFVGEGGDCDDGTAERSPGVSEVCNNGIDDNCDDVGCELLGDLDADDLTRVTSLHDKSRFGSALALATLAGAGGDALFVGAENMQVGAERTGAVFVFLDDLAGESYTTAAASARFDGPSGSAIAGASMSSADIDLDGELELVVGAPGASLVYLLDEPSLDEDSLDATAWSVFDGSNVGMGASVVASRDGWFASSSSSVAEVALVAVAGATLDDGDATFFDGVVGAQVSVIDLDGDGAEDLVLGLPEDAGAVHVVDANAPGGDPATYSMFSLIGDAASGVGATVSSADIDLDGWEDLLVANSAGIVTVFRGPSPDSRTFDLQIIGSSGSLGSAAAACDLDVDGRVDLALGNESTDSSAGEVVVFYGPALDGASLEDSDADLRIADGEGANSMGYALHCHAFGSTERDRLVIGSPHWNDGSDLFGAAYLLTAVGL